MAHKLNKDPSVVRNRIYYGVLAFLLMFGILSASIFFYLQNEKPVERIVKIGVLSPISGFMSGHGASINMGAAIAVEKINKEGGILGHQVKVILLDTKSDPPVAAERTRELIGRNQVDLIIGTGTSAETLAAIPDSEKSHTPFLYSLDGEAKTCMPNDNTSVAHWIWGTGFTERMVVKPLLETLAHHFVKNRRAIKIYFIGGDYVYPRTTNAYAKDVATSLGYSVVGDEYSDTSTQDYAPVIRRIETAKPDILIVTNPGESGVAFMRQARQMGLHKKLLISGFATFDQEALDAMGDASEGVYCVNRYSRRIQSPANAEFLSLFRTKYPTASTLPGPTAAAGAYGAILVAKAAFDKAGTLDRDAFARAMDNLEVVLPQGTIRVSEKNHIFEQPIYVMQIRGGEYEIIDVIDHAMHPDLEGCSVH